MLRECWSAERVDARGSVSERGFVSQGNQLTGATVTRSQVPTRPGCEDGATEPQP